MDCHHFISRRWKGLVKAAGLRANLRFHDLRHTCCVMLLVAGVNPRVVSDQMGHSDVAFTLRVYADALSSMHGGAADAMDDALGGTAPIQRRDQGPGRGTFAPTGPLRRPA